MNVIMKKSLSHQHSIRSTTFDIKLYTIDSQSIYGVCNYNLQKHSLELLHLIINFVLTCLDLKHLIHSSCS